MANWTSVKNTVAVAEGVTFDVDREGDKIVSLVINGPVGKMKLSATDWGGIKLFVPATEPTVKRFVVEGTIRDDVQVSAMYNTEHQANASKSYLDACGDCKLEIKEIEIPDPDAAK